MANRYWVGGSGNWDASTTTHWSATSGGTGGASVPTSADSVFIDANSGSSPTITMTTTVNCLDLNFTGAITPTFIGGSLTLNVYGSLTFISTMTTNLSGASISFQSTTTGKTITFAGRTVQVNQLSFDGTGGGWTLQDDLNIGTGYLYLTYGTLNTNGKTLTCGTFSSSSSTTRALTLGTSVINISGDWTFTTTTGLTFSANTSVINMTGATKTFAGGGLTYNNVTFAGTPSTVTGSNTFNTLTLTAGKTLKLTSVTTQTITTLICNGTLANPSTLQALTAGSPATIALPTGRYFIRHTSIKDITITGATAVTSIAGTNVSGNTGITFVTKFEIGRIKNDGSFNWYDPIAGIVTPPVTPSNSIINGNFSVNQRVVSGNVTLTAGAYGHDRWKAGAIGCTYTFATVNNITTITITAGSLIQVIEGLNLYSGTYVLSWTGTAQGRVGTGNFSASSITTSIIGGNNLNVEFGVGTLSKVQFNAGDTALPFQPRSFQQELFDCQRYYEKSYDYATSPGTASYTPQLFMSQSGALAASTAGNVAGGGGYFPFKNLKRINPTMTLYDYDGTVNAIRIYPADAKRSGLTVVANAKSTGSVQFLTFDNSSATAIASGSNIAANWIADAEL